MPLYDYRCRSCAHHFEALVRGSRAPNCPECGAEDLERLVSLPAVQSEATRGLAMKAAKKRDARQGAEREYTQREYEKNHD